MNEIIEGHFGDLVSVLLILVGGAMVTLTRDVISREFGRSICTAGFVGLKLTAPKKSNGRAGNGS